MNDEFLMRVDEELPSDQHTAVKVIETKVISEEYRTQIETLLQRIDAISAVNNTELIREMKDILAGLLDSITLINSKYSFLSEMMLKIEERSPQELSDKIDRLSAGLADILAGVQASIDSVKSEKPGTDPLLSDSVLKIEEKLNELSVMSAELNEKVESVAGDSREVLDRLEERIGDVSVSNASIGERLEALSQGHVDLSEKVGEISVSSAEIRERISELDGGAEKLEELAVSLAELKEKIDNLSSGDMASKLDEMAERMTEAREEMSSEMDGKLSRLSSEMTGAISDLNDKIIYVSDSLKDLKTAKAESAVPDLSNIEEKLGNVSLANSELLGNVYDSMRNAESKSEAVSDLLLKFEERIADLNSSSADKFARLDEKIASLSAETADELAGINEKIGDIGKPEVQIDTSGLNKTLEEVAEKLNSAYMVIGTLNEKINDALIQNKELQDRIEEIPSGDELLERINSRMELASEETQRLRRAVEEIDSRVRSQTEEIINALKALATKPKAVKRKPKRVKRTKRRAVRRRRRAPRPRVNNETLDILIVNALNTASMSISQLRDSTKIREAKLRERLNVLMARGVVIRERHGRYIVYVSQAEQPAPTG